jgi:hypothetical protein
MGLVGFLNFCPRRGASLDSSWAPFMSRITCG